MQVPKMPLLLGIIILISSSSSNSRVVLPQYFFVITTELESVHEVNDSATSNTQSVDVIEQQVGLFKV